MTRLPSLGPRGEGWLLIQIVLFFAVVVACVSAAADWLPVRSTVAQVVGVALFVLGWVLGMAGVVGLRRSLSPLPHPVDGAELVQDGIYGWVRNPIYAGLILIAVGASLWRGSGVGLLISAVLAVFLGLKARREEAWLRERFSGYDAYARRVRRFVPGLY